MTSCLDRWQEIDGQIKSGELPPKTASAAEHLYAIGVQRIYSGYSAGLISREAAISEKKALRIACAQHQEDIERYRAGCRAQQKSIADAAEYRARLAKSEDIRQALSLALRVISLMTGENETERTVLGKIERRKNI